CVAIGFTISLMDGNANIVFVNFHYSAGINGLYPYAGILVWDTVVMLILFQINMIIELDLGHLVPL
ncbi:unnamed protein product, partial [marine sediment metagenome]